MTAQLANGGYKIYPKIVVSNEDETYEQIKFKMMEESLELKEKKNSFIDMTHDILSTDKRYSPLYRNQENVKFVLDAMFRSTNEVYGTSYRSRLDDPKYQFAGKTGTSQVKRITEAERELDLDVEQIPYEQRDHAWFVAFGPYKDPRYAVSILVEHGGSGSKAAAPMAKELFKLIIDRHELRKNIKKDSVKV